MHKKALIAVNYSGFMHFMDSDKVLLEQFGYEVYVAGDYSLDITNGNYDSANKYTIHIPIASKSPLHKVNISAFRRYIELLNTIKFDVIICHTPITGLMVRMAAFKHRLKGTKVIYWSHGLAWTASSNLKERIKYKIPEILASTLCDAIITINDEDYLEAKQFPCKHIYKVNGVGFPIEKYKCSAREYQDVRAELGIPPNKIFILSVGELSLRKNHITILKAINLLSNKQDYVYAICGRVKTNSNCVQDMRQYANEHNIDFRLLGFRDDIPDIMHASDIGAIPSIREGLGMAGLQSLCAGVPLVGTNVQGIKEYIIPGKTGYLYNSNDIKGFADGISRLSDKTLRESMRTNCLSVVKNFDLSVSVEQRKNIYKEILNLK